MPYTISHGQEITSKSLNSFFFYLPFTLTGQGSIQLRQGATAPACYFAVLMDGHPRAPRPAEPVWRAGATAKDTVKIESTEDNVGSLVFDHMTLVNQVLIERENEWSELRIYQGGQSTRRLGVRWIASDGWSVRRGPRNEEADHCTKSFNFGDIKDAPCDETVVVRNNMGDPQRLTLCRRMIADTIVKEVMQHGRQMPTLTLKTAGNSSAVRSVPDRTFFSQVDGAVAVNRAGFVMIASGVFAFQSADTMLEEWRSVLLHGGVGGGIVSLEDVRNRLAGSPLRPITCRPTAVVSCGSSTTSISTTPMGSRRDRESTMRR